MTSLAETAYRAFLTGCGFKPNEIPSWEHVDTKEKEAWEAVAKKLRYQIYIEEMKK